MTRYNQELLDKICSRDNCTIEITTLPRLNSNAKILFSCGTINCILKGDKIFSNLYKSGGFCRECTKKRQYIKMKATFLEIYGYENPFQSDEIKKKIVESNIRIYGVAHPMMLKEQQNKAKETNLERYGNENVMHNADVKEKLRQTTNERFGHDNVFQNEEIKQKIQNVMIEKFGYAHALQNTDLAQKANKSAYQSKPFTFPCGKVSQVQGYEPFALELLVKNGKNYNDITTDRREVPEIWYETDDGKKHRYFCDILLHNEDKIVEVKSTWTFEKRQDNIPLKAQACIDAGFEYEIWIFDEKKNLKVQTYDKPVMSFTEMLLS